MFHRVHNGLLRFVTVTDSVRLQVVEDAVGEGGIFEDKDIVKERRKASREFMVNRLITGKAAEEYSMMNYPGNKKRGRYSSTFQVLGQTVKDAVGIFHRRQPYGWNFFTVTWRLRAIV